MLETKLYRLGKLEIREILDELAQKRNARGEIQQLLDDEPARWQIIRGELKKIIQTFGELRRTRIEGPLRRPWSSVRKITSSTRIPG